MASLERLALHDQTVGMILRGLFVLGVAASASIAQNRPMPPEAAPPQLSTTETRHFKIVFDGTPPSLELQETLEFGHANLMLDVSSLAPWAGSKKVTLYIVTNPASFKIPKSQQIGEPHIVLSAKNAENEAAQKLGSLYFESSFSKENPSPPWLSAGMHLIFWAERGTNPPSWLASTQKSIAKDSAPVMASLIETKTAPNWSTANGRLWHARAYSVVRFLFRSPRENFIKFCRELQRGSSTTEALKSSYGFTSIGSLESSWRADLDRR